MAEFAYTVVPGKLKSFLRKIREVSVPDKASNKWLYSIGFTSSNDRTMLRVLKFIRFIDEDGTPTDFWKQYRGANYRKVLAKAIQEGYAELFQIYPDACQRTDEELENFFKAKTKVAGDVIRRMVTTFRILCDVAEFNATEDLRDIPSPTDKRRLSSPSKEVMPSLSSIPSIHIDIQIHISPEASLEQIEAIFQNMAKYIFRAES